MKRNVILLTVFTGLLTDQFSTAMLIRDWNCHYYSGMHS